MIGHAAMRHVDRLVGVPLCAFLTGLRRLGRAFAGHGAGDGGEVRRILFVQLAESGSMVLADPAMRSVAARSDARLHCLTFARNRASLEIAGCIPDERVFGVRTDGVLVLLVDVWRFLRWARTVRIDAIVDLELFSRLSAALCFLTGVQRRAGFQRFAGIGLYRGDLFSRPVAFDPRLHMAQNYMMLVDALLRDGPSPLAVPEMPVERLLPRVRRRVVEEGERRAAQRKLRRLAPRTVEGGARLVLVNANASAMLPQRRWPEARFVALIRAVLARFGDVQVLLIGAGEDRATTTAIAAQVSDARCVDVAGQFTLGELPALFGLAAAMVSNDSGPAHFAAVTDLPVVVLFGPETPTLFRPLGDATVLSAGLPCSPCVNVNNQRRTRCTNNLCMRRIAVDEVFAALCRVLGDSALHGDGARECAETVAA
ncbi:MAG TPA: glycosyltransferase family 9 protein [Aromatoleum sp.]|uniref:glycosyltransferase family 9 protein n=1 Tax=Aromatoleum sp. TaxID=2307007 RepID=UPI002B48C1BB|nr:glycosyltransferase family 9 protein [Aromatoleum sp.]HJV25433.1 glycosyltransferase family 9 protein [Aromatoleum sp.]